MRLPIFICFCLGVALIDAYTLDKDDVGSLSKSDFDHGFQDNVLVEFYTHKCQHCDSQSSPLFNILKNSGWSTHIKLRKVDVSIEKEIADDYQIKESSTLKFFYPEGSAPVSYEGIGSVVEILNWLKRVTIALREVKSIHDAQSLINNNKAVAFFFGHVRSQAFHSFLSTASLCGDVIFAHSNQESLKKKYEIPMGPVLVLFEEFGAKKSVETQNFEKQAIRYFINNNDSPTNIIRTFGENGGLNILHNGLASLILLISDNEAGMKAVKAVEVTSPDLMSQIALLLVKQDNEYFDELTALLGISVESLPAVRILTGFEKFALEGEITSENIKAFVNDFKDKKLKPYLQSEPIPQNPHDKDGVRIVVGTNIQEVVFDENKDVLVVYYSSLKPECNDLTPISSSLIQRLQNVNDIVVAKVDVGVNEIKGFSKKPRNCPDFMLYPKGKKHNPLVYYGERTEDALFDFLINKPSVIPSFDSRRSFLEESKALVVLAGDDEAGVKAQDALKTASVGLRGKIELYIAKSSDRKFKLHAHLFGITKDSLPAVRILQGADPHKKFALEKEITPENLETFVEDFLNGKLKPYYKSEPVPENPYDENGIRVVVGKNFEEVVFDKNNDVLISYNFYASKLFDFPSLAHKLKNVTGVVIAEIKMFGNEVEGLRLKDFQYERSIMLYPKDDKQNPVSYTGNPMYPTKETENVMDFLRKHSSANIPEISTILRISKGALDKIFVEGQTALLMIISDDEAGARAEEAFETVSVDLKGEMLLILAKEGDDLIDTLIERCAISMDSIPTLMIAQPPKNKYFYHVKKFVFQSDITPANLKAFVEDFKNDKLQRYYKSDPIPDNSFDEDGIRIVVGKNFHEVVYDKNNDVLIAIYDSNRQYCNIAPILSLPRRLGNVNEVVIAKVDVYANEIDGFNSNDQECRNTLLYSRGAKQSPIYFNPKDYGDIIDFLKENTYLDIPMSQESSAILPYDEKVRTRVLRGFEALILITHDDEAGAKAEEALRTVSSDFKGEIIFSLAKKDANKSKRYVEKLAKELDVPLDILPVVRILKGDGNIWSIRRYSFEGQITPENLKQFIEDFQNGKLKPYEGIRKDSYRNYDINIDL